MMKISLAISKYANVFFLIEGRQESLQNIYKTFIEDNSFKLISLKENQYAVTPKAHLIKLGFLYKQTVPFLKTHPRLLFIVLSINEAIRCKLIHGWLVKKRVLKIKQLKIKIRALINLHEINSVVVDDDRSTDLTLLLLKVCNEEKIRSVIPSISDFATHEALLKVRRYNPRYYLCGHHGLSEELPMLYYKDKVTSRRYGFYPTDKSQAYSITKILPRDPWNVGGGNSQFLLVNEKSELTKAQNLGIDKNKLIVTGNIEFDTMYRSCRNRKSLKETLRSKYSINDKLIVTIALPQLAEHGFLTWKQHWKEIDYLCKELERKNVKALISLHPKMDILKYTYLEKKFNHRIVDEALSYILPASDIFLATFSSTIPWAVLCNTPSIIFDFYGFNYDVFDCIPGIIIANSKSKFEATLCELIESDDQRLSIKKRYKEYSGNLSKFDGKSEVRIVKAILG